jgi:hypothetical protein
MSVRSNVRRDIATLRANAERRRDDSGLDETAKVPNGGTRGACGEGRHSDFERQL